jgi:hypothetical protein
MSVFDSSSTVNTTLPSWFTSAQQNIATQAPTTYGAVTDPSKTVAAGLVSNLNSQLANPFTTSITGLQASQTANASPWLASGAPDTSTPLGGLFAAQNAKLDTLLPQITANEGAQGIGTGNYRSLRGDTATQTARAGALASLNADQLKAALEAGSQSIQAGQALGNVGAQYGSTGVNVANQEMLGGLPALAKYSDIINAMGPTTNKEVATVSKGSPYENLLKAFNAVGAAGSAYDKLTSGSTGLSWLDNILKNPSFAGSNAENNAGTDYSGDISQSGHWEGGEWVND